MEVKRFDAATLEILGVANIKPTVFNQSVGLFMALSNEQELLKYAQQSLYSPFTFDSLMSLKKARNLMK